MVNNSVNFAKMRFLIVDDQRPFLMLLRSMINAIGAQAVVAVRSSEAAVAACKKEKFDIIISDVQLGSNKKNGYQLLEEIRVLKFVKPETVFVIVSGDIQRQMVLGSLERQPDDFIAKPFSQAQLMNRLQRVYKKKQALKKIYQYHMQDDVKQAIKCCWDLINSGGPYQHACNTLLAELYWGSEQYQQALEMLQASFKKSPHPWLEMAIAKSHALLGNHDQAIELALKVTKNRLLTVEGHDILANSYSQKGYFDEAIAAVKKSLTLSPYSIERQYLGAKLARVSNDFEFAKQCCKAIFEQTRRSVYRDVTHLCNFVRSILDAAEHSEQKGERNKFQQEALITLQRLRNDDVLSRLTEQFDYSAFEDIINARLNFLDGKVSEAHRSFTKAQRSLGKRFKEYPLPMMPDSMKVLFDLGEFEQAHHMSTQLKRNHPIDPNIEYLLSKTDEGMREQLLEYREHLHRGHLFYNEGKYTAAYEAFGEALKMSPRNIDAMLSLLQALVQILEQSIKPNTAFAAVGKKTIGLLEGMYLSDLQLEKLQHIRLKLTGCVDRR